MPKTIKVAPGRKRLDKPKLKGMALFAFQANELKYKWFERIRNGYASATWEFYDEFQRQLLELSLAANAPALDKRMFYASSLQSMLEDIELFQERGY